VDPPCKGALRWVLPVSNVTSSRNHAVRARAGKGAMGYGKNRGTEERAPTEGMVVNVPIIYYHNNSSYVMQRHQCDMVGCFMPIAK
jgi:hypothetical protein